MKFLIFLAIFENFEILTFFVYCYEYQITAHPYGVEFQPHKNMRSRYMTVDIEVNEHKNMEVLNRILNGILTLSYFW